MSLWIEIKQNNEFRIDLESLDRFKQVLKCYEGTHNFHNFTVGKDFNDKSCKRYIISIEVSDPFIPLESKGEWVSIKIHGQSFMLHQIRKMIGLVILMVCTCNVVIKSNVDPKQYAIRSDYKLFRKRSY